MEPAHLVLDLTDLSLVAETAAVPASCWLFRRGPGDPAAMTDYFLVSLSGDSRTGAEAIARGHAISFADALHYVRDLRQGRAAGEVAARLVDHCQVMGRLDRASRLAAEREAFAGQFASQTPRTGLRGFLARKSPPFPARDHADLRTLEDWLARAVAAGA